jgi:hypothetical protein
MGQARLGREGGRFPFSPCGRRWREAPDEGASERLNWSIGAATASASPSTCEAAATPDPAALRASTFSRKGRRGGVREARLARPVAILIALSCGPSFAAVDCRTVADDLRRQDVLVKKQGAEISTRYADVSPPWNQLNSATKRDFVEHLTTYISAVHKDIEELRWLLDHHCGPAKYEPEAMASARDMEAEVQQMEKILAEVKRDAP